MNTRWILKSLTRKIAVAAMGISAIVGYTSTANAGPVIDPLLEQVMATESTEPITVIAVFNDAQAIPYLENSIRTYRDMRQALLNNTRDAQMRVYQSLQSGAESSNLQIEALPLWVSNTMLIRLPANLVKHLQSFDDIAVLVADREVNIIEPYAHNLTDAYAEADTFTYGLEKLQIPQLRQQNPNLDGRGITVGIIDTGIDAAHPALQGRVKSFKDFANKKTEPYDDNMHGTHVAGTIGGAGVNGKHIGVAPAVNFVVAKAFTARGGATLSIILQSMDYMADPDGNPDTPDHPVVISNSWGGSLGGDNDPAKNTFCKAVDNWVKLGILGVFASGNSGSRAGSVEMPAKCPSAFAVGATDQNDQIASFSSRGPGSWSTGQIIKPNVSAPGVKVESSIPGGRYASLSGTSMATPHVAGLAALVNQAQAGMSLNAVADILVKGVDDLGPQGTDNDFGAGRVNAVKTLGGGGQFRTEAYY